MRVVWKAKVRQWWNGERKPEESVQVFVAPNCYWLASDLLYFRMCHRRRRKALCDDVVIDLLERVEVLTI